MTTPVTPPAAPNPKFPRYSKESFPSYRFIPGLNPHPTEYPQGHSYQKQHTPIKPLNIKTWNTNPTYLWATDLYNYAFWWESHEVLEAFWRLAKKQNDELVSIYIQGLIKVNAAYLKLYMRQSRGWLILYEQARDHLREVQKSHDVYMGVDLNCYLKDLEKQFLAENLRKTKSCPVFFSNYAFLTLRDLSC